MSEKSRKTRETGTTGKTGKTGKSRKTGETGTILRAILFEFYGNFLNVFSFIKRSASLRQILESSPIFESYILRIFENVSSLSSYIVNMDRIWKFLVYLFYDSLN